MDEEETVDVIALITAIRPPRDAFEREFITEVMSGKRAALGGREEFWLDFYRTHERILRKLKSSGSRFASTDLLLAALRDFRQARGKVFAERANFIYEHCQPEVGRWGLLEADEEYETDFMSEEHYERVMEKASLEYAHALEAEIENLKIEKLFLSAKERLKKR